MDAGIYRLTFSRFTYIGQTAGLGARWGNHLRSLKAGTHRCSELQTYYNEHGSAGISFSVLESIDASTPYDKMLLDRERHWQSVMPGCLGRRGRSPKRSLSDAQVRAIRAALASGVKAQTIVAEFDTCPTIVSLIKSGKRYGDVV